MSKKKLIGTTSVDEKTIFPISNESSNIIGERNWAFWEILREKPEYLKLCEDIEFHETGLVSPRWCSENMQQFIEILNKAKELFGINTIVDPKKSQKNIQPDIIHLFGVAPMVIKAISSETSAPDENNRFIEDGKYVTLKVDITAKNNIIIPLLTDYLDYFREQSLDFQNNSSSGREHYSKQRKCLNIWRERKKKTPFSVIAREERISKDTAKKRYYRAYELIMGHAYNPDNYLKNQIFKSELKKTCRNCTDKECLESMKKSPDNWVPCPDVAPYADQDQRSRKEGKQASYQHLYSEDSDSVDD